MDKIWVLAEQRWRAGHPEVTKPLVNKVMESAVVMGAECLVTSCAMCQLNLEMRCTLKEKLPIFHFSEIFGPGVWGKGR